MKKYSDRAVIRVVIATGVSSNSPGSRIYITDNLGDIAGGALFSFALVHLVTPLQAIRLANLPLLVTVLFLFPVFYRYRLPVIISISVVIALLAGAVVRERASLAEIIL